jgi:hypothetical protein
MPTDLICRFSNEQLQAINNQAAIYMCACPAQVSEQLLHLRRLHAYQQRCITSGSVSDAVHRVIAEATQRAHEELERCLDQVLDMEGWDRATMTMPPGLRELRDKQI